MESMSPNQLSKKVADEVSPPHPPSMFLYIINAGLQRPKKYDWKGRSSFKKWILSTPLKFFDLKIDSPLYVLF